MHGPTQVSRTTWCVCVVHHISHPCGCTGCALHEHQRPSTRRADTQPRDAQSARTCTARAAILRSSTRGVNSAPCGPPSKPASTTVSSMRRASATGTAPGSHGRMLVSCDDACRLRRCTCVPGAGELLPQVSRPALDAGRGAHGARAVAATVAMLIASRSRDDSQLDAGATDTSHVQPTVAKADAVRRCDGDMLRS